MKDDRVAALLEPVLAYYALELEEVDVVPAGKRRVVRVVVDGDGPDGRGPLLDDIAEASRALSARLDESDAMGTAPYTLEVSSRGVSRPLTKPAHWTRNRDRLVLITTTGGEQVLGRVVGASDSAVTVTVDETQQTIALADIAKAMVQVELNRKPSADEPVLEADDESDDDEAGDDEADDDEADENDDENERQD